MLTLVLGRAGSGKTAFVMDEIKRRMSLRETGLLLLVPEQYSHDAERQLCAVCGDKLSLHGEALSFTSLCSRVFAETGGSAVETLDAGGQILVMRRALDASEHLLRAFGGCERSGLLEKLLASVRELKGLGISPDALLNLSQHTSGPLSDKLHDLSLIMGAYDAFFADTNADPMAKLDRLAEQIFASTVGDTGCLFFDGFNDFTVQELRVIERLMRKDAEITVCLTCDGLYGDDEVFSLPRKTAARLSGLAEKYGIEVAIKELDTNSQLKRPREPALAFAETHLFGHGTVHFTNPQNAVSLYAAPSMYRECEYAAYLIRELIRSGYRWREIGVTARSFAEYGPVCENVFEKYGIKYFSGGRTDVLLKPPVALLDAALEIVTSGWSYTSVFRYLKTGLTGIAADKLSEIENYVITWGIRGAMWTRGGDWALPPGGYGKTSDGDTEALFRINTLRKEITEPLKRLHSGITGNSSGAVKLRALYAFIEKLKLPERSADKAGTLRSRGDHRLADEYTQLWDIIKNAMEQLYAILGDTPLTALEFRKLFTLALSQYSVSVIPTSLDRTFLGDMAMSRRRDLRCLIVLGASDDLLPYPDAPGGVLSAGERDELSVLGGGSDGISVPENREERLCRELNIIYSALTLPSERLVLMYSTAENRRPSFIVRRLKAMFGLSERVLSEEEYLTAAENTCYELALLSGGVSDSPCASAAREYFSRLPPDNPYHIKLSADETDARREKLSEEAAKSLYGVRPTLSPSRADRFYACAFSHFMKNGLKLAPRTPAGFTAPEAGTFTHFVLEGILRELKSSSGVSAADAELCGALTASLTDTYVSKTLLDFEGKNARFRHLFRRLAEDTKRVALDMVEELQHSDFVPLDFELELSELPAEGGIAPPRGIIDRVDGFHYDGRLFLRVIDYKTGKKTLELSDILHGMGMQMLIYLFALQKHGKARYGSEIVPAGALYVPARDTIVRAPRSTPDSELERIRAKEKRRGGLILNDPAIIDAMERGGPEKRYLPVKTGKDGYTGDALADTRQLNLLCEHVDSMVKKAIGEISGGSVERAPYYKSPEDNACLYCDFRAVCGFDETRGDRVRYFSKIKPSEFWTALESGEVK